MITLCRVAALLFATLASPAVADPLHAVCSLERPLIGYGESTAVTVLIDRPAGTPLQITWDADGGVLSKGAGSASMVWAPASQVPAVFSIQAHVVASGETASCTARIAVTDRLTRGSDKTVVSTRSLLAPDGREASGYGLYSYILFTAPQTAQDRSFVESLLKSYLSFLPTLEALEAQYPNTYPRSQLNISYVPIAHSLPDDFDQRDDQVVWIRNHYDYDRALAFLTRLRRLAGADVAMLGGTVWIVSCLQPLSGEQDPRPVLPQNLTAVPARLIPVVVRYFAQQTTQPRDYNPYAIVKLRLDLRITIGQFADGLQSIMAAWKILGSDGVAQ
jgi:hypothetical protein